MVEFHPNSGPLVYIGGKGALTYIGVVFYVTTAFFNLDVLKFFILNKSVTNLQSRFPYLLNSNVGSSYKTYF